MMTDVRQTRALPGPGDILLVRALKADGKAYRWWRTRLEAITPEHIVTMNHIGDVVEGTERGWSYKHHTRTIYWFDRPYNLAEVYEPNGRLKQLYVHIASPARLEGRCLIYTDLELDVVKRPGQPIRVVDEDEFLDAAAIFGYSPEFQECCYRAVEEAAHLVLCWCEAGAPRRRRR